MTDCTPSGQPPREGDITRLLQNMDQGDPEAAEALFARLYRELHVIAASKMAREIPGQTLQATDLVHEVWLRLMGDGEQPFPNRAYFFAAAAEAMRRILVERARRKKRLKHGGNMERVDIDCIELPTPLPDDQLLALNEALTRFAEANPEAAEVVKLVFFVDFTHEQTANVLEISVSTVERRLAFARAWLYREIKKGQSGQG